jgi:hypothetical protein
VDRVRKRREELSGMSKMDELARKVREARLASDDAEENRQRHQLAYEASRQAEKKANDILWDALAALRDAALGEDA